MKTVYHLIIGSYLAFQGQAQIVNATTPAELEVAETARVAHAKELMGTYYRKSAVRTAEKYAGLDLYIRLRVEELLPKKYKKSADTIARTLIEEANRYSLDPMFLMAVIKTESSFNPSMVGGVGEIGLMQIRPCTAEWIISTMKLPLNKKASLADPRQNIRVGAAYFAYLRGQFKVEKGHYSRLYISAYNMGPGNVRKNLRKDVLPEIYAGKVMRYYVGLYRDLDLQAHAYGMTARNGSQVAQAN